MKQNKNIFPSLGIAAALLIATMFASCTKAELEAPVVKQGAEIRFGIEKKGISKPITKSGSKSDSRVLVDYDPNDPCSLGLSMTVVDGIETPKSHLPATKGTQVSQKEQLTAFDVVSYFYADESAEDGAFVFADEVTDGVNTSKKTYYWPSFGVMNFIATYPATLFRNDDIKTIADQQGHPKSFTYTIPQAVEEQQDIMIAMTNDVDCTEGAPVPLQFKHLLAAVQFKVGDVVACDIRKITIEGIKIGTLTYTYNESSSKWDYELTSPVTKNYSFEFTSEAIEEVSGIELNGNDNNTMLLIAPQSIEKDQIRISVSYDNLLTESTELVVKSAYLPAGTWAMGTTTSYSINIGAEGVVIPNPGNQDAHYTMVHMPYDLSGLASSKLSNLKAFVELYDAAGELIQDENQQVTLKYKNDLTYLQSLNYWTEYQIPEGGTTRTNVRGGTTIDLTAIDGTNNPLVLFVPANVSNQDRYGILYVTADFGTQKDMVVGGGYFVQKCPSWSYDEVNKKYIGVERIEEEYPSEENGLVVSDDLHYPYGFSWDRDVKYSNLTTGIRAWFSDSIESIIGVNVNDDTEVTVQMGTFGGETIKKDPYSLEGTNGFIKYHVANPVGGIFGDLIADNYIRYVMLEYEAISNLNNVATSGDGHVNTVNLYNYTAGVNVSDFENSLDNLVDQGLLTKEESNNVDNISNDYAAFTAIKKNKFYEVVSRTTTENGEISMFTPRIANDNITWYLPASAQAQYIVDADDNYALNGTYWTSTAVLNNNQQSYYYTFANKEYIGTASGNRITTDSYIGHKVRAVVDWTGSTSPIVNEN